MGYNTSYSLEFTPHEPEVEVYLEANEDTFYGINPDGSNNDEVKWYEHEADMIRLSKQFPKITFVLSGEGEENGDAWKKRFIDGKLETSRAALVYPEFAPGRSNRS